MVSFALNRCKAENTPARGIPLHLFSLHEQMIEIDTQTDLIL